MGIPDGLVEVTPKSYVEKNSVSNDYIQSSLMEGFLNTFVIMKI
ncbi:hypothetical protein [Clostridium beijerinckii]|nr:hypothetical protein [Clostridium beijerinckii]NRT69990.1 hypothetical protein [Clostridium beijerinckii]